MTRAELAQIFNEVDATFADSESYRETLSLLERDLAAGVASREVILFNGAFELSKRFMFEVMSKVACDSSEDNR